jgi:hypothetical protein
MDHVWHDRPSSSLQRTTYFKTYTDSSTGSSYKYMATGTTPTPHTHAPLALLLFPTSYRSLYLQPFSPRRCSYTSAPPPPTKLPSVCRCPSPFFHALFYFPILDFYPFKAFGYTFQHYIITWTFVSTFFNFPSRKAEAYTIVIKRSHRKTNFSLFLSPSFKFPCDLIFYTLAASISAFVA